MRVIFLCFHHRANDARLFHREMKIINRNIDNIEIVIINRYGIFNLTEMLRGNFDGRNPLLLEREKTYLLPNWVSKCIKSRPIIKKIENILSIYFRSGLKRNLDELFTILKSLPTISRLHPKIIQASDTRELHWAILLRLFTRAEVIYDVHEDYFNQIYEYSGKSPFSLLHAIFSEIKERTLLPFVHQIFCADDYLFERYSKRLGKYKPVAILRNFPYMTDDFPIVSTFEEKKVLDLVYIGGINPYRGVIECAEYVSLFNQRMDNSKKLTFTVFSGSHPIITDLVQRQLIRHIPSVDYINLLSELIKYDVGICLLHHIRKYERNLPMKNFDYMSVGLPIVTSNFGYLQKYAEASGGAYCIDPMAYQDFESAILRLFDPSERMRLGNNGRNYIKNIASFQKEATQYIKTFIPNV
jgi:glycosyltransferase involved in cell wall biosynthesis